MTARERVLASRLIQKIDNNELYARQIGLSCVVSLVGINKNNTKTVGQREKKNNLRMIHENGRRFYQTRGAQNLNKREGNFKI